MKLHINVAIQIQKPVDVVFEAIVNPDQMSQYFISKSNGKMEEGKSLAWNFPEFDADAPVRVGKNISNELITFYWEIKQVEVEGEMQLQQKPDGSTVIRIIEKEMDNNDAGITWLKGNTEGWANFLACLKAYMEYGINLRKGAFVFRF